MRAEDRWYPRIIVPERFSFGRIRQRRRCIQSECLCDGGALDFTGGWSELRKLVCENSGQLLAD